MQSESQIDASQTQNRILPNPPNQINNIFPQNNIYQIIQNEEPNKCEKFSKFFTGSTNLPIGVFTILMLSCAYHIHTIFWTYGFLSLYFNISSFFDFIFALLVWSWLAKKIEIISTTVKYCYLFFINLLIISIFTFSFPLKRIWNFVLFETLLIAFNNMNKEMKFFCCKITGKKVIIFTIIYHLIFNIYQIFSIIFTIAYAFIYEKWLIQKINISNDRIKNMEYFCIIYHLKNKFKTFITLEDVLKKENSKQNNNNGINNVNSSFVPNNIYPNYYSQMIQNNPMQGPIQPAVGIPQFPPNAQPVVNINQNY